MSIDFAYDEAFSDVHSLKWMPWVGKDYNQHRVLILGESCYDDGDDWMENNPNVPRDIVSKVGYSIVDDRRFFREVENSIMCRTGCRPKKRATLWDSVAFMNLVQRLLPSSSHRPTDKDFETGWVNFLEVAKILKPIVCIQYGYLSKSRLSYVLSHYDTGWKRESTKDFSAVPPVINLVSATHQMRIITNYPASAHSFAFAKWAKHIRRHFPEVDMLFVQDDFNLL